MRLIVKWGGWETLKLSPVQKWRTAPKANSDDFSPPGSREPCPHQRLNTGPSEVMSFKSLYIQEDI